MLDPIQVRGVPQAQGCWERAYALEALQSDSFDIMKTFLGRYVNVGEFAVRNVSAGWEPTYVTVSTDFFYLIFLQGTENIKQAMLHLAGVGYTRVLGGRGIVNSAWDVVAAHILDDIRDEIGTHPDLLGVDICGHSYGGAVASLLGRRIAGAFEDVPLSVCTFGSPKPTGGTLPPFHPAQYVRVRHSIDVVPTLPPANVTVAPRQVLLGGAVDRGALVNWAPEGTGVLIDQDGGFATDYSDGAADRAALTAPPQNWEQAHPIYRYRLSLAASGVVTVPPGVSEPTPREVAAIQAQPPAPLVPDVTDPAVLAQINAVYYGQGAAIVNAANALRFESTSMFAGPARLTRRANNGEFRSRPMGVPSGYTKITMVINNGRYGRLESHVTPIPLTSFSLVQAAYNDLLNHRAQLLGNTGVNTPASLKGLGNPQIQFVKIQDAFLPKEGFIVDLTKKGFFGPAPGGLAFPADTNFTALSTRLLGTLFSDFRQGNPLAPIDRYTSLLLTGGPDDAVKAGDLDATFARNGVNYLADVSAYLDYLCLQGGQYIWGFAGLSSHEQKWPITSWQVIVPPAPAQPYWTFTAVTAGFNAGDRVRITGASPNFNGTFAVTPDLPNTYSFRGAPATGQQAPRGGFAQRVSLGTDGSRAAGFYPYKAYIHSGPGLAQVKVSKKDPGREFLNVTFRHRTRKHR